MSAVITALGVPLGAVMRACYHLTQSYGAAILLFTLLSKLALLPVGVWVHKNAIRIVRVQPALNEARARFFGDADMIAREQGRLYKQAKYNPFISLIPLLLQIVLLMGLVDVIYHPFDYLLHLPKDAIAALCALTGELTGADIASSSIQLRVLSALHAGEYAARFAALPQAEAVRAAAGLKTAFLGVDLCAAPVNAGGGMLLLPVIAGFSAWLLCFAQNAKNVLQSEQGKANKYGTMALSVGLSLYLGAFVPAGVALYWIAGNLLAIAQLFLLNALIDPRKQVDYARLEESKQKLRALQSVGGKRSAQERARERADYKRFFSVANKHLAFYSESAGFYKYYDKLIGELLRRSNVVIHYITSDPHDPVLLPERQTERFKAYYIGDKKLITLFMKMDADVVVMTMPGLDNYHYKRSYVRRDISYVYLFHYPLSTHMVLPRGSLDHYDTVLCVGEFQFEEIRRAEQLDHLPAKKLVACGYGQLELLDDAYQKMDKTPRARPQVLIAPSWQPDNILDSCIDALLRALLGRGLDVIVRPHPEYVKRFGAKFAALEARYQGYTGNDLRFEGDFSGNDTIFGSDIVITDWSGTAYEFSFVTLRPCVFIETPPKINNPAYEKIGIEPLEFSLRSQIGARVPLSALADTGEVVHALLEAGETWERQIMEIRARTIANFGASGKAAYRAVMDELKARAAR